MKGVIDDIKVEAYGVDEWKVLEEFDWYGITVPVGFITDFASIPTLLRSFINPVGRIRPAALVHDYIYSKTGILHDRTLTRKECDKEFLKIMKVVKMNWFKSRLAYRGVRIGGWVGWNRRKNELTDH